MNHPEPSPKSQPKTSLKSITILILISFLFAIFLIEIVTRLVPGLIPNVVRIYFVDENYQKWGLTGDEDLGFKYAPALIDFSVPFDDDSGKRGRYPVSTVSLGYENAGFRDDGIDGEIYAVVVGDSFASCAGVKMENCWVEILEQHSEQDFANLGVISFGAQQTQRMLTKYGLPLDPKLVLWVFFANDPYDTWRFEQFGKAEAKEGKVWESPVFGWILKNSATYEVLAFFWYNRYFFYNLGTRDGETMPMESNWVWWQTITNPTDPMAIEGLKLTQDAISEAKQQTQSKFGDTEFVVIIVPTREQVYLNDTILQAQLDVLNAELVEFAQTQDISVIDLTPAMRAVIQDEPFLYFRHDMHLNPRGNEVVAELLEQALADILAE